MKQLTIGAGPAATLIAAGDEDNPVSRLIQNVDPNNTAYFGNDIGVNPANPLMGVPLGPGQTMIADGTQNVYAIASPGQTVQVNVLEGVSGFFQPTSLSSIGGAAVYVQTTAPHGKIPLNSIWFNLTTGSLETYNGSTWIAQQFDAQQLIQVATILSAQIANQAIGTAQLANGAVTATQVANGTLTTAQLAAAAGILGGQIANATITSGNIAANTIVAANIAANTITAAQLAAGIIYAGIVNGTTIQGGTFIVGTSPNPQVQITTQALAGIINFLFNTANIGTGTITGDIATSGGGTFGQVFVNGPPRTAPAGDTDYVGIELNSSDGNATTPSSANLELIYNDAGGTAHNYAYLDRNGFTGELFNLWPSGQPAAPPTELPGARFYCTTQGTAMGIVPYAASPGIIPASQADYTSFTNTTTSMNRMCKLWTLNANEYYNVVTYRLSCWGHGTTGTSQNQLNMLMSAFGLTFGGNNMPATDIPVSSSFHWKFHIEMIVGASAQIMFGGYFTWSQAAVTANRGTAAIDGSVSPTPGGNTNIAYQMAWATTTGAPTIMCQASILERMAA